MPKDEHIARPADRVLIDDYGTVVVVHPKCPYFCPCQSLVPETVTDNVGRIQDAYAPSDWTVVDGNRWWRSQGRLVPAFDLEWLPAYLDAYPLAPSVSRDDTNGQS